MDDISSNRKDHRIILHFDYDCFYAAVFERENPILRSLPLAVQQKQIIVTCNYEARKRGLYKLQLVREAREKCPDVIVKLGEDLTRFRDASKEMFSCLKSQIWSNKIERLGFDEVFMDVTDMIEYNLSLLNPNDLTTSFFHLHRSDPTVGFHYSASSVVGNVFPASTQSQMSFDVGNEDLGQRLCLGSHLAQYMRLLLEEKTGFTSTAGISTNKLLSKLVGNLNKPEGQTTLIPPYIPNPTGRGHVHDLVDDHDIGRLPGIGFKTAQKIRSHILGRDPAHDSGLVYGGTKENVKVGGVRLHAEMGPESLHRILDEPGSPKDLPVRIWGLINGVDDSEVANGRDFPQQISIEDSYTKLDELPEVKRELQMLGASLLKRMRVDLTSDEEDFKYSHSSKEESSSSDASCPGTRRWLAHPRTIRLSTRPRPPLNPDGTRTRTFARISKSSSMPRFVFTLNSDVNILAERLVTETLMPLFCKLHPEKSAWNLSLVNVCASNMVITASDGKDSAGRDISWMFKRQDEVLKDWKIEDTGVGMLSVECDTMKPLTGTSVHRSSEVKRISNTERLPCGSEDEPITTQESDSWDSEGETTDIGEACKICGAIIPAFAMVAHDRFHNMHDYE